MDMLQSGLVPNVIIYSPLVAVAGSCWARSPGRGTRLHHCMKKSGNHTELALELLADLQWNGLLQEAITYSLGDIC